MLKVAFSTPKGGIGKTTITVIVASYLHYQTDNRVIVLDADYPQFSIQSMRQRDIAQVNKNDYYKTLAYNQFTNSNKKAYPILSGKPIHILQELNSIFPDDYDIALLDFPGTVGNEGVLETISQLDCLFISITADFVVMDVTLKFATVLQDLLKSGQTPLKGIFLFWNMINAHERSGLYLAYQNVIGELGLNLLKTQLPDTVRYKKEIQAEKRSVFRSTLFPPSSRLIKGSNIDTLVEEIRGIIKL